jgi:hypothetical protein
LLATVTTVSGYVLLSPRQSWSGPVQYWVDSAGLASVADGDRGVSRVMAAITGTSAWNGSSSGIVVKAIRTTGGALDVDDGIPMLKFSDPFLSCRGACLAATYTGQQRERVSGSGSREIFDADIVTNASAVAWTSEVEDPLGRGCANEVYVDSVMVHEVGHALGLAHTPIANATMFAMTGYCQFHRRTIEGDDNDGLLDLYGQSPYFFDANPGSAYTWYLGGPGATRQEPRGGFYDTVVTGWHRGFLVGPSSTHFDLYLERWNGSAWIVQSSNTASGSVKEVAFEAPTGRYRFRVVSVSGSGEYHFWLQRP